MYKPLETQLTILQQEGYSITRFLMWWIAHPFNYTISSKKPLVITQKVKRLINISYIIFGTLVIFSIITEKLLFIPAVLLLFLIQPYLFLAFALLVIRPLEIINRKRTIKRIRTEILNHTDLTVVGITGSYGKTSVKDFLFFIVSGWQESIKTPESYNTIFGIAKVVDLELLSKTKLFICEMGAYVRGEIAELCQMVSPKYAILTAIGSQHLERFRKISNTTLAKFEIIDSVRSPNALVNIDNPFIAERLALPKYRGVKTFSLADSKADYFIKSHHLTSTGLKFTLTHNKRDYTFISKLFGTSNLYNLTAAISMAMILKVPTDVIRDRVEDIIPSPHRLELKKIHQATLIDNAFSSNEEGFTTLISDLSTLNGKKVLITPGVVELGARTWQVHQKLGQLSNPVFDEVILVGKSIRTMSFEQGYRKKVSYVDNSTNLWPLIEKLSQKYDWILLENDLPDIF